MILTKLFYKKKYVIPFIKNLTHEHSMNNAIFFSEYNSEKFLIILCINNEIFEVKNDELGITFYKFNINIDNFAEWSDYKQKIIKMKEQAFSSNSKHLIILMSENIRHISNQFKLSFKETKDIFSFLLKKNQPFFINNKINLTDNTLSYWID